MTVIARRVRATPHRSASETWEFLVDLLAPDANSVARKELLEITGITSSLISDEVLRDAPCVVWGSGPKLRIYCLHDLDAITGQRASEGALTFCPTEGDWEMSLPCDADDLDWVRTALEKLSTRVSVRERTTSLVEEDSKGITNEGPAINREAFLKR